MSIFKSFHVYDITHYKMHISTLYTVHKYVYKKKELKLIAKKNIRPNGYCEKTAPRFFFFFFIKVLNFHLREQIDDIFVLM